jgi:hypothetical protein
MEASVTRRPLVVATGEPRANPVLATVTPQGISVTIERSSGGAVDSSRTSREASKEEEMRKLVTSLLGAALVIAAVSAAISWTTTSASAGAIVDPATLQPVPPNAVCRADGSYVICDTFVDETLVNEPIFDLPCGTVYETSSYHGAGTRWYVNGLLVKRHVAARLDGTWSLSLTGAGPTLKETANYSTDSYWPVPGNGGDETAVTTDHGSNFKVSAPGVGVIIQDSGSVYPDGTHRGLLRGLPSPETAAALCAAFAS